MNFGQKNFTDLKRPRGRFYSSRVTPLNQFQPISTKLCTSTNFNQTLYINLIDLQGGQNNIIFNIPHVANASLYPNHSGRI